jgi:hypothetical protein
MLETTGEEAMGYPSKGIWPLTGIRVDFLPQIKTLDVYPSDEYSPERGDMLLIYFEATKVEERGTSLFLRPARCVSEDIEIPSFPEFKWFAEARIPRLDFLDDIEFLQLQVEIYDIEKPPVKADMAKVREWGKKAIIVNETHDAIKTILSLLPKGDPVRFKGEKFLRTYAKIIPRTS